jgi:WhiB family redox-sensing transcriptional regulator
MSLRDWASKAACRGRDLELFFGVEGERGDARNIRETEAKQICLRCPVREACLEDAMAHHDRHGVFGGMTADERADARRNWLSRKRRAAA